MNKLGQRIRQTRRDKGFTLQELARETGISYQAIGQYERGERKPSFMQLTRLAKAFNLPVANLIGDDPELNEALKASILNSPQVLEAHAAVSQLIEGTSAIDVVDKLREFQGSDDYNVKLAQYLQDSEAKQKNAVLEFVAASDALAGDGIGYVLLRFLKAYGQLNEMGREHALQNIEDMVQVTRFQKEPVFKRVFPMD